MYQRNKPYALTYTMLHVKFILKINKKSSPIIPDQLLVYTLHECTWLQEVRLIWREAPQYKEIVLMIYCKYSQIN